MSERKYHSEIGSIEVITGPMFSGKTDELLRRISRSFIAKQKTLLFKPNIDSRYSETHVVAHNNNKLEAISVDLAIDILGLSVDADVIGIDEAQFFGNDIIEVCNKLANNGKRVIVTGLDKNFKGLPFAPLPQLICIADYATKLQAICMECTAPASFTFRINESSQEILIGESKDYEALCRKCFHKKIHYIR